MVLKVMVVAGASGGHIYPALSFIEALKDKDRQAKIVLVLPKRSKLSEILAVGFEKKLISTSSIKIGPNWQFFKNIFSFFKGLMESFFLFLEYNPEVVVGFGSIDSVPLVMLACIARKKTLIHEQNVIPGRANMFLAHFVDRVAISFPQTLNYLSFIKDRVVLSGNPLRRQLKSIEKNKALDFFGLSPDKFTFLVMGGSLGSHSINNYFISALSGFSDLSGIQVIHISGQDGYRLVKERYAKMNIDVRVFNYFDQMQYAYSAADLAFCRAGALTISELIFFALPAVVVPYPFAYKHQLQNANVLKDYGCALVLEEEGLDVGRLCQAIEGLVNNPVTLQKMRTNYKNLSMPEADKVLVEALFSLEDLKTDN